jgi:hypothetical protein
MTSQVQINNVSITITEENIIISYPKHRRYNLTVNGKQIRQEKEK